MYGEMAFWIELKKELSVGDLKKLQSSGFRSMSQPDKDKEVELNIDYSALLFMKVRIWLNDWSLVDDKGKVLPRDLDTLKSLREPVFQLIEDAVDRHAEVERNERKNAQSGEPKPLPTSA